MDHRRTRLPRRARAEVASLVRGATRPGDRAGGGPGPAGGADRSTKLRRKSRTRSGPRAAAPGRRPAPRAPPGPARPERATGLASVVKAARPRHRRRGPRAGGRPPPAPPRPVMRPTSNTSKLKKFDRRAPRLSLTRYTVHKTVLVGKLRARLEGCGPTRRSGPRASERARESARGCSHVLRP